jgi:hypothetical protein
LVQSRQFYIHGRSQSLGADVVEQIGQGSYGIGLLDTVLGTSWSPNRPFYSFSPTIENGGRMFPVIPSGLDVFIQDDSLLVLARLAVASLELLEVPVVRSAHEWAPFG